MMTVHAGSAVSRSTHFAKRLRAAACLAFAAAVLTSCNSTIFSSGPASSPTAVKVRVDAAKGLIRGGKPYFVKGAGGGGRINELAGRGANSLRTWTTGGLAAILDDAQKNGLTVSAGIWLESECSWFSYKNPAQCDKQAERVRTEVMQFRNHPALLAWGLGNEADNGVSNDAYWKQIERLALLVHEIDPAHPTYTAVAGLSQSRADDINAYAPHLDYVGINTYGGVNSLREHLKKIGWTRPWMLTEWGPRGFWESPKSAFGAPLEQTSSEKADMIRAAYQKTVFEGGGCLGSYVFLWGWKFEATSTWFGLLTHEGETTAAVDTLQELWSGTKPVNRAPAIKGMLGVPKSPTAPGGTFDASVQASDPEGDPLVWTWVVLPEEKAGRKMPVAVAGAIASATGDHVTVTAPAKPGIYRLHVSVTDGKGHVATANMPFEVR